MSECVHTHELKANCGAISSTVGIFSGRPHVFVTHCNSCECQVTGMTCISLE